MSGYYRNSDRCITKCCLSTLPLPSRLSLLHCKLFVCVQVVDNEENSSPEWDRVYPLLDSEEETPEFETHAQEDDQKHPPPPPASDEEELQEDLSKLENFQDTYCGEDRKRELSTQGETTPDSGVESEELRGPRVSQESHPESMTDPGTCGESSTSDPSAEFWVRTRWVTVVQR